MAREIKGLVDAYGNPLKREDLTREIAAPGFGTVRQAAMGNPVDGLTPGRLGVIMREADAGDPLRYFEVAEIIEERDLHYAGVLGTRKRQVSQIPIRVEAASDAAADVKQADMIEAWLRRDVLREELFDILDAVGKGLSFTEIIWDTSEGQWMPARLEWRTQRFFSVDRQNLETPLYRGEDGLEQPLPAFKFLVARIKAKSGLTIRSGLARLAAWAFMWKKFTERDWALFTQSYGQPIRVGRYTAGATEEEKQKLLMAVTNIAADCAAVIPHGMAIEFVEAKSAAQSSDAYLARCSYIDQQVSKGVLGQTATTDAISGGHAVGKEHREVQKDIASADAGALQAVLNMQLIKPWIDLNFGPQKAYPRVIIEEPEAEDLEKLFANVEKIVRMGAKVSASEMRDKLNLSEPGPDDELLQPDASATGGMMGKEPPMPKPSLRAQLHSAAPAAPERDVIDDLADLAAEGWEPLLSPLAEQIRMELEASASLQEFRDRLTRLTATADVTALAEALGDARTVAFMAGLAEPPKANG